MRAVPLDLLHVSPLRPPTPLPWPGPQAVALARAVGGVEPVTVRPLPGASPPRYEILAGLRHWLLAQRAALPTVPVHVHVLEDLGDADARRLIELDAGPVPPDPIAEAEAIRAEVNRGRSVAAVGRDRGLSRTEASHRLRLRLLRLAPAVRAQVAAGALAAGKARALVGLDERAQLELMHRIARESLNTRQVEALAQAGKRSLREAGGVPVSPPPAAKDPDLARLEAELSERLGTRVAVDGGAGGGGRLVVDFADPGILEGVLERLGYKH